MGNTTAMTKKKIILYKILNIDCFGLKVTIVPVFCVWHSKNSTMDFKATNLLGVFIPDVTEIHVCLEGFI